MHLVTLYIFSSLLKACPNVTLAVELDVKQYANLPFRVRLTGGARVVAAYSIKEVAVDLLTA